MTQGSRVAVKVWDLPSGRCLHDFVEHDGPVGCVALSDTLLVSGCDDAVVRVWDFGAEPAP